MRLVYTADLHGNIESYRALLDLAVMSQAKVAIVGGDLLPHAINRQSAIQTQRDFVEQDLRPLLEAFHAAHSDIDVYLLAGNDDWAAAIAALDALEADGLAYPLHHRVYVVETIHEPENERNPLVKSDRQTALFLAGYACVPPTPFSIKDYERRDDGPVLLWSFEMAYTSDTGVITPIEAEVIEARPSIGDDLAVLAQQSDPVRTIYVCHTPPANTPLDQMPNDKHVGSRALRAFIETHAPPLTLHGHIHEAPRMSGRFATRLGTTWCVNPGNDQRRFHAVTLDTDDVEGTLEHTVYGRVMKG
jgi:Icc-related predicted phosphoesterase